MASKLPDVSIIHVAWDTGPYRETQVAERHGLAGSVHTERSAKNCLTHLSNRERSKLKLELRPYNVYVQTHSQTNVVEKKIRRISI